MHDPRVILPGPVVSADPEAWVDAPVPADDDDGMCPDCVTPWKCNGPQGGEG